jgi:2-oxoglutarate ferredoxin oxidoreductase subunit alpha
MSEGAAVSHKRVETLGAVVIRFAGDSGDGMQVTGTQFTSESAIAGNDIATLPDFPAEIRAPAGTLAGVSAFQLNFSSGEVFTPGDDLDVLVAMNPAALKTNVGDLKSGGILIVDREGFTDQNLRRAGFAANPLEDGSLKGKYQVFPIDVAKLTQNALKDLSLSAREVFRCRNFLCLGIVSWLYHRPLEPAEAFIHDRFKKNPKFVEANLRVLKAGFNFAETTELFAVSYEVRPARIAPGTYRNVTGNTATALGFVAAAQKAGRPLFLGSYPITPASDVLHELAALKRFDVFTFQAEDEIAGIGAALGAAFGGSIAITTTSGPGMNLKAETMGLALAVELPLVITDIQRAGPSTGMPTKTEQADLMIAMYGRHGESPLPIIAASTPADCFLAAYEAVRIAVKYMTPVILMTDGYLANGAEPWLVPDPDALPPIPVTFRSDPQGYFPYKRDETNLARDWVVPGTPGLEHRIGGLEKSDLTGNVDYSPGNHHKMVMNRVNKVAGIANYIPLQEVEGPRSGDLFVMSWGGTCGSVRTAVQQVQAQGRSVAHAHLRYLNPFPKNLGDIIKNYKKVLIPELNTGQLRLLIRAKYLVDAQGLNKIQGKPFLVHEIVQKIEEMLK